jgi:hypothetical protein
MTGVPKTPPGGWTPYILRFFSYGTWGVLYPFFPLWLLGSGLFTVSGCGLVVGAAVLANRLGSLAFVRVLRPGSERRFVIGSQVAMGAASAVMCLMGLLSVRSLAAWLLVSAAFGLASSLATLAQLTMIVNQFDSVHTRSAFSYENIALNAAGGVAPLISSLVYTASERFYALAPIGFAFVGILLATRLTSRSTNPADAPAGARSAMPGRAVVAILLTANFLTTLAYAQFYGVFSAYATPLLGAQRVGVLFAAGSVAIVLLQSLVTRWSRTTGEPALVVLSNLAMAAGTALLAAAGAGMPVMLLAVLGITLGEMIYGPVYQTLAVGISGGRPTVAIGALTFVWGLAESLAVVCGLSLVGAGMGLVSFLGGATTCLAAAALVRVFRRHFTAMAAFANSKSAEPAKLPAHS